MTKLLMVIIAATFGVAGCAVHVNWFASGGSRADGVVKLSFEYGALRTPEVDDQQGLDLAKSKCKGWGYSGAEAFGGVTTTCNVYSGDMCARYLVTAEYQCLGHPENSAP